MRQRLDLTGQQYGRLKVVSPAPNKGRLTYWFCDCTCGTKSHSVSTLNLRSKEVVSCGCLQRERAGRHLYKHGLSKTPEFRIWCSMRQRCYDPNVRHYARYGGRGITVSEAWLKSFENFYTDMGPRPTPLHTLERKDNSLGYSADNCVWATQHTQSRNTRHNRWITIDGRTACLQDWFHILDILPGTYWMRRRSGLSIEEALTTPVLPRKKRNNG